MIITKEFHVLLWNHYHPERQEVSDKMLLSDHLGCPGTAISMFLCMCVLIVNYKIFISPKPCQLPKLAACQNTDVLRTELQFMDWTHDATHAGSTIHVMHVNFQVSRQLKNSETTSQTAHNLWTFQVICGSQTRWLTADGRHQQIASTVNQVSIQHKCHHEYDDITLHLQRLVKPQLKIRLL